MSRRSLTIGLALPVFVGGWLAAVVFGAQDYVPWLTSPAVIAGLGVTLVAGLLLLRHGAIGPGQIVAAMLVGGLGFGLSLLLVFLAILAFWFRPAGPVGPSAFSWAVYNRTETTVAVGPVLGLAPCASTRLAAVQFPGPEATTMPGAIPLSVGFRSPNGFTGVLSVVVAADATHVYVGEIAPADLPACQGQPQP